MLPSSRPKMYKLKARISSCELKKSFSLPRSLPGKNVIGLSRVCKSGFQIPNRFEKVELTKFSSDEDAGRAFLLSPSGRKASHNENRISPGKRRSVVMIRRLS